MKSLIKQVEPLKYYKMDFVRSIEANWDKFSDNEKELTYQSLDEIGFKILKLSGGQLEDFYCLYAKRSVDTKDSSVYELLKECFDWEAKTKKVLEFDIENM